MFCGFMEHMNKPSKLGIYVHWPFCKLKCPYCDFNSHVRDSIDEDAWTKSYVKALKHYAELAPGREVVSVFFGGGTPSLMGPSTVESIIFAIQKNWQVANDVEITLEANPTSVEVEKFEGFKQAGVNRVSLGVQALNDPDLKFLGREHSAEEAIRAVDIARNVFDRYSFDLMYARPNQNLNNWEEELENALQYMDSHSSLYQLTIERNTPFYMSHARGEFSIPNEELASDFYKLTQDILGSAGLSAYEVSNHAREGEESQHNLIYWRYGDYIGVGPGAHGRLSTAEGKFATREHQAPEIWLEKIEAQGFAYHPFEALSPRDQFVEGLMMGLRLEEGLSLEELGQKTGCDWGDVLTQGKVEELQKEGWLSFQESHIQLNHEGWLRLNAIIPHILK